LESFKLKRVCLPHQELHSGEEVQLNMLHFQYIILSLILSSASAMHLTSRSGGDSQCWRYLLPKGNQFDIGSSKLQKFIVLSQLRSGSNLLTHLLDNAPNVMSNSEVFAPDGIYPSRWLQNWTTHDHYDYFLNDWDVAARDNDRGGFINALFRHALDENFTHCGFKVLANQLHEPEFQSLARAPDVKKIILKRRNVLKQFVSKLKADALNEFYEVNTSHVKVHVNITEFQWFAEDADLCYDTCLIPSMAPNSFHIVAYEDLLEHLDETMADVLAFLQHPGQTQIKSLTKKQDSRPLSESIDNWMDVVRALTNTQYEEHLGLTPPHAM
jgi:hypothetical protein